MLQNLNPFNKILYKVKNPFFTIAAFIGTQLGTNPNPVWELDPQN